MDNFTMSENSGSFGMQQRQDRFDAIGDLIVGPPGPQGPQGPPGADGTVSFDELTPAQRESLRGEGVPAGGTTGQVLAKASNTDYDTEWVDQSGGGGGTSDYTDLSNKPSINDVTLSGNKTAAQLGLAAASDIPTVPVQSVNGKTGAVELSASDVSALPTAGGTMSGAINMNGNRITNVPTPTHYLDAANKNYVDTRYIKPASGIPKSDLASAVQTSLGLADSALQAVPSTYRTAAAQDAIDAAQDSNLATIESSQATAAHAVGDYIVYNGKLYKVTAAIAPGETLTPGTNISAVSGGGLNDLKRIVNYNPTMIATGVTLLGRSLMTVYGDFFFFRAVVQVTTAQTQNAELFQLPNYNYDTTTTANVLVSRVDGDNGYTTVSIVNQKIRVMLPGGMAVGRYEIILFGKCT